MSTTILLICDDEKQRSELHQILLPEYEVYSSNHFTAKEMKNRLRNKDYLILETDYYIEPTLREKISIYPCDERKKKDYKDVMKRILGFLGMDE